MTAWTRQLRDGIEIVSLKTDAMNTLNTEILRGLTEILTEVEKAPPLNRPSALLLTSGQEKVFSYGMNPEFFVKSPMNQREELFIALMELIQAYAVLGVPIIADINGPALAGGAVLAAMADFSLIHLDRGKVCFSEVKVGIPVPEPIFNLLGRRIAQHAVSEMLTLGKNVLAPELLELGFCHVGYQSDNVRLVELGKLVGRMQRIDPRVLAVTLKAAKHGLYQSVDAFMKEFKVTFSPFLSDEFAGRGLKALLEAK